MSNLPAYNRHVSLPATDTERAKDPNPQVFGANSILPTALLHRFLIKVSPSTMKVPA